MSSEDQARVSRIAQYSWRGPRGVPERRVDEPDLLRASIPVAVDVVASSCLSLHDSLVELCAYLCVKWKIQVVNPEGTAEEGPNARPAGPSGQCPQVSRSGAMPDASRGQRAAMVDQQGRMPSRPRVRVH